MHKIDSPPIHSSSDTLSLCPPLVLRLTAVASMSRQFITATEQKGSQTTSSLSAAISCVRDYLEVVAASEEQIRDVETLSPSKLHAGQDSPLGQLLQALPRASADAAKGSDGDGSSSPWAAHENLNFVASSPIISHQRILQQQVMVCCGRSLFVRGLIFGRF